MATYAIGDIQGCFATFERLLSRVGFGRGDRLWSVGDVVNRGAGSLAALRWMVAHDSQVTCVLGNHELHLLARADALAAANPGDTLAPILEASDRDRLLGWLRGRPLVHLEGRHLMVHAGLLPLWTPSDAAARARRVEAYLRGAASDRRALLGAIVDRTRDGGVASGASDVALERARAAAAVLTRLRYVDASGAMLSGFKGPPEDAPMGHRPWFEGRARRTTLVFGHWAALGLHLTPRLLGLDSGCVWGGLLTAVRLEDRAVFAVARSDADRA